MPQPPQLMVGFGIENRRPKGYASGLGRLEANLEALTGGKLATDPADERVPFRVRGEIGEDAPHTRCAGVDLDLGM